MASQILKFSISSLYTNPNPFSAAPAGSLAIANNIVIDRENIGESRRGFKQYGLPLVGLKKYLRYNDTLLAHVGTTLRYDSDNAGTWVSYSGSFTEPASPIAMQSAQLQQALFFTSLGGVYRLDTVTGTPRRAGVSPGLSMTLSLNGASGFLANTKTVAYRIVFGYRDANGQLVLGSPSPRHVITNSAGATRNVSIQFAVPADLEVGDVYQVYRSEQSASTSPSDELQLVVEKSLTAPDLAAFNVTYVDSIPDDQKEAFIYTAASQEGILQANERPPIANDIAMFNQHMFYFNCRFPHRVVAQLATNPTIGNTITVAGKTYTAAAAENIGLAEFKVGTTLSDTIQSLCNVININTAGTTLVYAIQVDDSSIRFEVRSATGALFTITSSNAAIFSKALPISSVAESYPNRVYISKPQQGDSVPLLSYLEQGSGSEGILRGLSVRDAVFSLKGDGIYRITGTNVDNFLSEPHDPTVEVIAPNAAAVLDNLVFCFTTLGPVAIGVNGIDDQIGLPIERTLKQFSKLSNFNSMAHAIGYDSDRRMLFALPEDSSVSSANAIYVFSNLTKGWTRWPLDVTTMIVSTRNDSLYLGRATDDQPVEERKSFTLSDYADDEYAVTITAFTSTTVTVSSVPAGVVAGMSLTQATSESVISAINGLVFTLATADQLWTNAAATVSTPIPVEMQWIPDDASNPSLVKHHGEATLFFEDAGFDSIDFLVSSNFADGFYTTSLSSTSTGAWGEFEWPSGPDPEWGGGRGGIEAIRTFIPRETTRASWLNIRLELNQAFTSFSCAGCEIKFNVMDTKFR
jgi:hypothetical protein